MQLLYFNGEMVDIDEKTAIGININAYDVKKPSRPLRNVSNKFSIPKTARNHRIIGFFGNTHSTSTIVYDSIECQYWVDNYRLVNGKCYVTEVNERIHVYIYDVVDIWEQLKLIPMFEFQASYLEWLDVPKLGDEVTYNEIFDFLSEKLRIGYFKGNLDTSENDIILKNGDNNGSHFIASVHSIFEYINSIGGSFDLTFFEDEFAQKIYVPFWNINVLKNANGFYFGVDVMPFSPHSIQEAYQNKSVYDLISSFFTLFNVIQERDVMMRFDDISEVKILKNIQEITSYTPSISGYSQRNYIKFQKVYDGANEFLGSKYLEQKNKNIKSDKTVIATVNSYLGNIISSTNTAADLSVKDALENFSFLIVEENRNVNIIHFSDNITHDAVVCRFYTVAGEYNVFSEIIKYPEVVKLKKWFSLNEIIDFRFSKLYQIKGLEGLYFVNKINGFNPKSKNAIDIELLKWKK